ncbi:Eco57I restriction-modification methylase domain-containing protein [Rhodoflexus caldus]|uniref:Eco57I restriction-modification methylase domain-containing protein n=1 Tax=Rhodoflexus caldus TaxID=2891236 RepID=UPI00202A60E0|nr:N-6 DNA methylase [Rhodoflexus caldus]
MEAEILSAQSRKNKFGQYFTPEAVAEFMIDMAHITPTSKILEPSCGEGVFLKLLQEKGFQDITAYEIDKDLATEFPFVNYESFVAAKISEKFDLIIGNPPYIRWKNLEEELKAELAVNPLWNRYFNSLCDYLYIFILKSIELLNENGQLIFICPEYWMNTTHSVSLRNYMIQNGCFEEIYHFNETPIFDKVTVSVVIFKFVKTKKKDKKIKVTKFYANRKLTKETLENLKKKNSIEDAVYLEISQFKINERWLLATDEVKNELQKIETACRKPPMNLSLSLFESEKPVYYTIGEFCDIGNGLVSGLDKAFQISEHIDECHFTKYEKAATIHVVKAKDLKPFYANKTTKYIFVGDIASEDKLQELYPNFYSHLQPYKIDLTKRYQYNRKINYWEWVFLRNISLFNRPEKRIFVPCKERISNKNHFRFALVNEGVFPTQDVTAIFKKTTTQESVEYILAYLNHPAIFNWLKYNGIIKGNIVEFSEKPIASIPFRKINWHDSREVQLHEKITSLTQNFLSERNHGLLKEINNLFIQLLDI